MSSVVTMAGAAPAAALLAAQKAAHERDGPPGAAVRRERLERCVALLSLHKEDIVAALGADFGARSADMSRLTDIAAAIAPLKFARAKLEGWMRPERRQVEAPLGLIGAKAEVRFQPKGVVGIISPWNFPVQLTFAPLAGVLAAGNRCLIKPSELTPATGALLAQLFSLFFKPEEAAVVTGGPEIGAAFAALPFDHLVFTGSGAVAKHVMRAAAENLTPLTLELGGKSPVILSRTADLEKAAARIMAGKTMNAGQICLAPDYLLAPSALCEAFVAAAGAAVAKMYPKLKNNPDYASLIDHRHYERVRALLADARAKGARIIELNPLKEDFSQQEHWKIPPALVLDVTDDMRIMQEEIFGPLLPVKTYGALDEALAAVNARPRPLAVYYFGNDRAEMEAILAGTVSGGVAVNDVVFHASVEDLPFGGVGASGMGAYHGRDGFLEFSHKKAVFTQTPHELTALLRPPYGEMFRKFLAPRLK
ncbi:MAG: coniferyl aldehyde dehydrogenase [Hyphomonadaceae bacterium]